MPPQLVCVGPKGPSPDHCDNGPAGERSPVQLAWRTLLSARLRELSAAVRELEAQLREGGGAERAAKLHQQGKMTAR